MNYRIDFRYNKKKQIFDVTALGCTPRFIIEKVPSLELGEAWLKKAIEEYENNPEVEDGKQFVYVGEDNRPNMAFCFETVDNKKYVRPAIHNTEIVTEDGRKWLGNFNKLKMYRCWGVDEITWLKETMSSFNPKTQRIDHIDGDITNYKIENLKLVELEQEATEND